MHYGKVAAIVVDVFETSGIDKGGQVAVDGVGVEIVLGALGRMDVNENGLRLTATL